MNVGMTSTERAEPRASARNAMRLVSLAAGVLFGAGLVLGGMTQPTRVIGFLDIFGDWDPTLAFVMIGAIAVHLPVYRLIRGRTAPRFAPTWSLPTRRDIDARLIVGAILFGAGWGLGGFCPGPALTALPKGGGVILFIAAMLAGMVAVGRLDKR